MGVSMRKRAKGWDHLNVLAERLKRVKPGTKEHADVMRQIDELMDALDGKEESPDPEIEEAWARQYGR